MVCRIFHSWGPWIKTNEQNTIEIDNGKQVIQLHDRYSRACNGCGTTQQKTEWNHKRLSVLGFA